VTITVVDATGQTTTATLHNLLGPRDTAAAPAVVVTPRSIDATTTGCNGATFSFVVGSGTPPYNVSPRSVRRVKQSTHASAGGPRQLASTAWWTGRLPKIAEYDFLVVESAVERRLRGALQP
jgi:hypothetical protein